MMGAIFLAAHSLCRSILRSNDFIRISFFRVLWLGVPWFMNFLKQNKSLYSCFFYVYVCWRFVLQCCWCCWLVVVLVLVRCYCLHGTFANIIILLYYTCEERHHVFFCIYTFVWFRAEGCRCWCAATVAVLHVWFFSTI